MKKTLVIGAGVSGLAASIRLATQGHQVDVIEARSGPGGKIDEWRSGGFRFDTGPSLFTWPELMEDLFRSAGARMQDYIPTHRLSLITRYFFSDGRRLDAFAQPEDFAAEMEKVLGEPAKNVLSYLNEAKWLFKKTQAVFLENSLSFKKIFSAQYLRAYPALPRLQALRSLDAYHRSSFNSPEAVQLFNRYATYNGSDPYQAPATLRVISHLEHNAGAWFPDQGMYSIAQGLYNLALEKGVHFHFNTRLSGIEIKKNELNRIHTQAGPMKADQYISAIDIRQWKNLEAGRLVNEKPDKILSSSALIYFWGVKKTFPNLKLHNIFFSKDYAREFRLLFQDRQLSDDLTIYVYVSKKEVAADAPEGMENWFVMVNAPPDFGQDWDEIKRRAKEQILARLRGALGESISEHIVTERIIGPPELAVHSGSYRGALYGPSSNNPFSAFRRQPNKARLKGLYHIGGSVHPGGGIPLCLLSARIVSQEIIAKR